MYLWADWNVCSEKLFDWDLCLRETDQLICNINELTNSYIVRAFIESYFQKNIVVCSWIPFCKKGSYRKETSQLICNTNSVGFCWKTLLHRLWLTSPSRMDLFFVSIGYMRNLLQKKLQSPDTNIIFLVSGREQIIKIIKSALLKVSQNNNRRDSHVYKC